MKRILALILTSFLIASLAINVSAADDGLLFHFKMDNGEFGKDECGNGTSTVVGDISSVEGKFGSAAYFDGIESGVWVVSQIPDQDVISISGWVYAEFLNGLLGVIVAPWVDSGDICVEVMNDGRLENHNKDSTAVYYESENAISEGEWAFFTLVNDNVNGYSDYYINGELDTHIEFDPVSAIPYSLNDFCIGAFFFATTPDDGGAPMRVLPGSIDDLRVYGRALTQDEVLQLMNDGEIANSSVPAEEAPTEEPAAEAPGFATADEAIASIGKTAIAGYEFITGAEGAFGGEGPENLWDGDTATKLCTNTLPASSTAKLDGSYTIDGVTIALANDNAEYGRVPTDWTLSGSTDGENWTVITTGDDSMFVKENGNFRYFAKSFDASEAYSYVKIDIAGSTDDIVQISEVVLTGAKAAAPVDQTLDAKAEAPNTFDFGVVAAVAAVISLGGFAVSKKKH